MADIFIKYYSLDISRQQLLSSIVFVNSRPAFEEIFIGRNENQLITPETLRNLVPDTQAFTDRRDSKVFINTTHDSFIKGLTDEDPKYPYNWNPLKSLRIALFHEFNHLLSISGTDTALFAVLDPNNEYHDKRIEGFKIRGLNNKNQYAGDYDSIDEAFVELMSKKINTDLFGDFVGEYKDAEGNDVIAIMDRLEQVLNAANINNKELMRLHKSSNLRGFLLLLVDRSHIDMRAVPEPVKISIGTRLLRALIQNDQVVLQDYMNKARTR